MPASPPAPPAGSSAGLRTGTCQVWWARRTPLPARLEEILDEHERSRAAAYRREADRERFVIGCVVTRRVLGAHLGLSPAAVPLDRTCRDCGRPHGKVRLAIEGEPVQLSVSHSGDLVAIAFHRSAPVGIDVERTDPSLDPAELCANVLTSVERAALFGLEPASRPGAFTRYWTRKEAVVKATGEGLRARLDDIAVSAPWEPARLLSRVGRADLVRMTRLHDLDARPGYSAALAVLGEDPPVHELDAARWL